MEYGVVAKVLGYLLMLEAGLMTPALLIALYYKSEDWLALLISIFVTGIIGFILSKAFRYRDNVQIKEGMVIVGLGWILVSLFGSLPFILSGAIPSWIDAFFESVSGFTTTGSSIVDNIESFPKGVLFWRSFIHWIGGMGILVFTVALLPMLGLGAFQLFRTESPGPRPDRIVPRVRDSARILYKIYSVITIIQITLLVVGGMPFYDSMLHAFGTVGTGGFGIKNNSVGFYDSSYIHLIIASFMTICGLNFSLYYSLIKGKWREVIRDEELRLYLGIILISIVLIALNIYNSMNYSDFFLALRDSYFQVSSIITTTGYSTVDFDQWPAFSKIILFILMLIGGCAGSTAGGIKVIRILVLLKAIKAEIIRVLHPRAIIPVKVNDKPVSKDIVTGIAIFLALYMVIFLLGTLVISLDGVDFESAVSTMAASLNNIGPAFGFAGPAWTFSQFSPAIILLFSVFNLLGRLEFFTLFILINPRLWKSEGFNRRLN